MSVPFTQLVGATYDAVVNEKNKAANQFAESAFLTALEKHGGIKRVPGGAKLDFTVDYRANAGTDFLATDTTATSTTKTEVLTEAQYDRATLVVPVNWSITDEILNSDQMLTPTPDPRADELYGLLNQRATQGLDVNRNDPVIRAQADAYGAQEERARRDNMADLAERSGPNANLRGETRLGYERMGQRVGAFEAELMGRELQARRDEIAQALQLSANFLSTEQQRDLQRQIALLDNAIAQQQAGNAGLGVSQQWMEALLENAQFLDDLAARERDRRSYYDLVQSGQL